METGNHMIKYNELAIYFYFNNKIKAIKLTREYYTWYWFLKITILNYANYTWKKFKAGLMKYLLSKITKFRIYYLQIN